MSINLNLHQPGIVLIHAASHSNRCFHLSNFIDLECKEFNALNENNQELNPFIEEDETSEKIKDFGNSKIFETVNSYGNRGSVPKNKNKIRNLTKRRRLKAVNYIKKNLNKGIKRYNIKMKFKIKKSFITMTKEDFYEKYISKDFSIKEILADFSRVNRRIFKKMKKRIFYPYFEIFLSTKISTFFEDKECDFSDGMYVKNFDMPIKS